MKAISSIVSGDENAKNAAFGEGLFIGGVRYVMTRAEGRSIYARSVRYPYRHLFPPSHLTDMLTTGTCRCRHRKDQPGYRRRPPRRGPDRR